MDITIYSLCEFPMLIRGNSTSFYYEKAGTTEANQRGVQEKSLPFPLSKDNLLLYLVKICPNLLFFSFDQIYFHLKL